MTGSAKITIHSSLVHPRIVSQDSNVFRLARMGRVEEIKALFSARLATSRDTTVYGVSLLHTAARLRNLDLMRLLIQERAYVNVPDEDGEVPLHAALAFEDNYDAVRLLLANGADLANQSTESRTPMHTIFNSTIGQMLRAADTIEETERDYTGMSISHFVAWSSRSTAIDFQRGRMHDLTDLWAPDTSGRTCLHLAASRGNLSILEYLLERAMPHHVRSTDVQGLSPLHYAVRSTRVGPAVDLLLAKGGDILARDQSGCNILHHATRWNSLEGIKKSLTLGADESLLAPDSHGCMPSQYASRQPLSEAYIYMSHIESARSPTMIQSRVNSSIPRYEDICTKVQHGRPSEGVWFRFCHCLTGHRRIPRMGIAVFVVLLAALVKLYSVASVLPNHEEREDRKHDVL
ncbi:MAG: hypothetical protein Q9186_007581 [Xanthomendoza sp. 1 TL-2023]